jgi:hypothetical protein
MISAFWLRNFKGIDYVENVDVSGSIILKWILNMIS